MSNEAEEIREELEKLHGIEEEAEVVEEEEPEVEEDEPEAEEEIAEEPEASDEADIEESADEDVNENLDQIDSWADAPPELKKAIRRDREELKATKAEARAQKEQINAILQELQNRKASDVPAEDTPDRELEPEEYAAYTADKTAKEFSAFREQQELQQAMNITKQRLVESEAIYDKPDYQEAKAFAMNTGRNTLRQQNPTMTDMQIEGLLEQEVANVVAGAMKQNVNPAETLYLLATRGGYQAAAGGPVTDLAAIKKNQAKSKNLGQAAGSSIKSTVTMADLINMPGSDMAEWKVDNPEAWQDILTEGFTKRQVKKKRSRK